MAIAIPKEDQRNKILFVDDDKNFLQGLRLMLRKQRDEFVLHFVESADDALRAVENEDYDVIVSDVSMPGKSGLHLLKELRSLERTKDTPVVMLTGNAEANLKRRALDLGATDLLNKPVTTEDLVARLRSVARLKSYQDELKDYNETLEEKVQFRTQELERSRRDIIWRLAKAGEFRDEETGDHVIRVACYARALAEEMHLDTSTVQSIFITSPLHDIGKIGIPDRILLTPNELTPEERATIETHCDIGTAILLDEPKGVRAFLQLPMENIDPNRSYAPDELIRLAAEIALSHHEHWDGGGYPRRLREDEIPISGRIVALADVYDALRSERPYKKAYSVQETRAAIDDEAETHFDPAVYQAFTRIAPLFEDIRTQFTD